MFISTQTEAENDMRSSNDIMMTDKSVRHVSVSKEKKLAKKLKNQAKKSFKKLLILFMRQKIHEITIQNILKFSLSVHKMMFQNLSSKLHKNIDNDEVIQILLIAIDNDEENSELSILWAVRILKYHVNIDKKSYKVCWIITLKSMWYYIMLYWNWDSQFNQTLLL